MSSIAANQGRTFAQLYKELHPFFRTDRNLPARIQQRLASERRFGSRDRRLYRELLYTAVRFLPWIEAKEHTSSEAMLEAAVWLASSLPALASLKAEIGASLGVALPTVAEKARLLGVDLPLLPDWASTQCPPATVSPNLDVLHTRAPLWLRFQTADTAPVLQEFGTRGWKWQSSSRLADAVELLGEVDVTSTVAYKNGHIEVQDIASQLLLHAVGAEARTQWFDACAGAGGKTLQLAHLVGPSGHVVAHDVRTAALTELSQRVRRAGLRNVTVGDPGSGTYDGVLVDAPCTGTGTWRRSPHLKWCTTARTIADASDLQKLLLEKFSNRVRSGGLLIYATCSLCLDENERVVEDFLARHSDFEPASFRETFGGVLGQASLTFWPAVHNSDGFFVAALRRR